MEVQLFFGGQFKRSLRSVEFRFFGQRREVVEAVCALLTQTYSLKEVEAIFGRDKRYMNEIRQLAFKIGETERYALLDLLICVYGE